MRSSIALIYEMARQDVKDRFAGSVLGGLWVFVWPLVQLFIYIIIFGKFMGGRLPGNSEVHAYGIYVASGLIPWTCFVNTLLRTARVFADKKHIITKIRVKLPLFPLYIQITEFIPFIFSTMILIMITVFFGFQLTIKSFFLLFLVFYVQQVLSLGVGILFATFSVFFKDLNEMLSISVQLLFWFTPIVYTKEILPEYIIPFININPMFHIVEAMHKIFIYNADVDIENLLIIFIASHVLLAMSVFILKKIETDVRDFI